MDVTLDTNILVSDFHFRKPHSQVFLEGLSLIPAKLHLSEVVLDETINKFREILDEKSKKLNKLQNEVNALLDPPKITIDLTHVRRETEEYERRLKKVLKSVNARILPYPELEHKEIVRQILLRKKPFKNDDSGYRDFLIWQTIKKLEVLGTEEIVFITNNTADFGAGPDLPEDLEGKITKNKNFKICLSIGKFNDEYIIPRLKKLEQLTEKLQQGKIGNFEFKKWLDDRLFILLSAYNLNNIIVELPKSVGDVRLSNIIVFDDYHIMSVKELESGDKLLIFNIDLRIEASINLSLDDILNYEKVRNFTDKLDKTMVGINYISSNLKVRGHLILNKDDLAVISEELTEVYGPYGGSFYVN